MKKSKKNISEAQDNARATNRYGSCSKIICSGEPVPLNLLEKPNEARAKHWANTDMPSDFWL
ncbi:MAG: hypothetical protein LBK18_03765 [Prevotellaceae bacterium]|nr:hypothetical protein [Prevotellaceae bacterium]